MAGPAGRQQRGIGPVSGAGSRAREAAQSPGSVAGGGSWQVLFVALGLPMLQVVTRAGLRRVQAVPLEVGYGQD